MPNKKHQALLVAVVITVISLPAFVFAFDGKNEQETLRGINALHVIVHDIDPEVEQYGLTREKIQKDFETSLEMAGIKVLSEEKSLKVPGVPFITLTVGTMRAFTTKGSEFYLISILIKLRQNVYLERKPRNRIHGIATWSNTRFGVNFGQNIRTEVNKAIDQFINAHAAANSK
ncbi:MAG: hypothetical protein B1H12_02655 [Desulfobacteraceae bacterium 4484_190.2]|nr:MAG: hypothetical protein B1H12_02655 [Desulfobacteraceae bacterium 4484_190.2]